MLSSEMKELHSSNSISSGSGGRKQGAAAAPCAACKLLRRRCAQDCVFAPYFPADEPQKFANVHKVFGASNVNKMLQELEEEQRGDAASSMVYEANARVRDPVYGCVRVISSLQQQLDVLQTQLAVAQAEVIHLRIRQGSTALATVPGTTTTTHNHDHNHNHNHNHHAHAHLHNINDDDTNTSSPSHSPSSASRLHTSKSLSLSPTIDMNMMLVDQQPNINMGVSLWSC